MNHIQHINAHELINNIDLNKAITLAIPSETACIVKISFSKEEGRWQRKSIWHLPIKRNRTKRDVFVDTVYNSFKKLPNIDHYQHISFVFIKYFPGTCKTLAASIQLIAMYDNEEKKFYGIPVLYEFKQRYKRHILNIDKELTTIADWSGESRESKYLEYIDRQLEYGAVLLITPDQMYMRGGVVPLNGREE